VSKILSILVFHLDQVISQELSLREAITSMTFVHGIKVQALFFVAEGILIHFCVLYIIPFLDKSLVLSFNFISVWYLFIKVTFHLDLYLFF